MRMNNETVACAHKESGRNCPISKTPCLGECIYANILDDISLGIIGLDIGKKEVFFQNKLANEIFRESIQPKDYKALAAVLIESIRISDTSPLKSSYTIQFGKKFIGYTIYIISSNYFWIYLSDITEKMRLNAIAEAVNTMNNLGYIFSGIRHELGNPINSIKTTISVCKKNLQTYSKETISEFIDRVLSDITRVEILLKDLKNSGFTQNAFSPRQYGHNPRTLPHSGRTRAAPSVTSSNLPHTRAIMCRTTGEGLPAA